MPTLKKFQDRYNKLNDDFMIYTSKVHPPTLEQINQYEKDKGISINSDIREFLLHFGSLILEVKEDIWKRPQEFDVLPAWKFGYGFFVYGLSSDANFPDWLSYDEKNLEAKNDDATALGQLF